MTFTTMAHSRTNWNRVAISSIFILFSGVIGLLFFFMMSTYNDGYRGIAAFCLLANVCVSFALFCVTDMLIEQDKQVAFVFSCALTGIAGALIYTHWF